ncbi:MAG: hypothetical protein DWQ44_05575 [Bacteroidetes bacterium]|nr:MAG: hypothetical protein DWQ33_01160 [Bacteroidota bacterium]REK03492.1 MAG: hypothetical protein DWQ39_09850 [Bacteroidota bacterium]REK34797.1 MAG: hypothetical protein DWQ44_05575 [Bacteroidota bacterium]REK51323.1 MAG: hypothetical protein DWQ48_01575 [Bacteroidota bacterium]
MNNGIVLKKSVRIALWISLLFAFIISVGFTDSRQANMKCSELMISVNDSTGQSFVEARDIRQIILDKFGEIEGQTLSNINISLLEKIIDNNPFVADAEVFSSVNGKLNIEVTQRKPVVRVFNIKQESFYIDDQGEFMPLSEKYTARVPVANGFIPEQESDINLLIKKEFNSPDTTGKKSAISRVYAIADFLNRNDFWNAQIEQIYINASGEIELIPRVGLHTIIIGNTEGLQEKFDRLYTFYNDGLNKTGWNKYSTINLKFKDQVVCTKK